MDRGIIGRSSPGHSSSYPSVFQEGAFSPSPALPPGEGHRTACLQVQTPVRTRRAGPCPEAHLGEPRSRISSCPWMVPLLASPLPSDPPLLGDTLDSDRRDPDTQGLRGGRGTQGVAPKASQARLQLSL